MAAGFYKFMKLLEYETANPNADTDYTAPPIPSFVPERDPAHMADDAPSEDRIDTLGGDKNHRNRPERRPPSGISSRPLSGSSTLGRLVLDPSLLNKSPNLPQGPHIPGLSGVEGGKGPTYPPTEGAANYPSTAKDTVKAFDAASAAEAGEYEHCRVERN